MNKRKILTAEFYFRSGLIAYLSSERYTSKPTDAIGSVSFMGYLNDIRYQRSGSSRVWRRRGGELFNPLSSVVVDNSDGTFDYWTEESITDQPVIFRLGYEGMDYDDFIQVGAAIGDRLEIVDTEKATIYLKSKLQLLEKQITDAWDETVPLEVLRRQHRPITIGLVNFSEGILFNSADDGTTPDWPIPRATFFISDEPIYIIDYISSEGQQLNPAYDIFGNFRPFNVEFGSGFERVRAGTAGEYQRHAASVYGNVFIGDLFFNDDFDRWTDDVPNDWTVVGVDESNYLGENPTGWVEFRTLTGPGAWIERGFAFVEGQYYLIKFRVIGDGVGDGPIQVTDGSGVLYEAYTDGVHNFVYHASSGPVSLAFGQFTATYFSLIRMDYIEIYECARVDTTREALEYLLIHKGQLTTDDVDLDSLENVLDANMGYFTPKGDNSILSVVQLILDSIAAFAYTSSLNKIKFFGLSEPDETPDFVIRQKDIVDGVTYEDDVAESLTQEVKYDINYAIHTASEIRYSSAILSQMLISDYKIARSEETLHPDYVAATERPPMDSVLREFSDAMYVIEAICALYTERRRFYTLTATVNDIEAYLIEPGMTVEIQHNRLNIAGNYIVVHAESGFLSNVVTLTVWGKQ